ncbi:MAG TPA: sulfotransferase domain-containing protein [Mycobacteriales bacterium]|nr:sulfotransferase domain-containing protein [Mycobacteriales bacterium]
MDEAFGAPVRYVSRDEDSARWRDFPLRRGDIVISTRSKSGTTWMQAICGLLVFGTPTLPAPIAELSPWLDFRVTPLQEVLARLDAQTHRRFIKTHTPLDGLPLEPHVTYLVVARHPLDAAVSLYHQGNNLDRELMRRLSGQPESPTPPLPRPDLHDWLVRWIDNEVSPTEDLDSIRGFLWHLSDAWSRRHANNVVLVHYDDLLADLDGQMRRLAGLLGSTVPPDQWPALVAAATFERMRSQPDQFIPTAGGIHKNSAAFFRRGRSGAAAEILTKEEQARYYARAAQLAPPDLLAWLHRPKPAAESPGR